MILAKDFSLIGYGVTSLKPYQARRGFGEVGNTSELKVTHQVDKKSQPNFRTGIGNNNTRSRITGVNGSFSLHDITVSALAMVLNAKVIGVAAGIVTGEVQPTAGEAAEHIVFANLVDTTAEATIIALPASADAAATAGNSGDGAIGNGVPGKASVNGVAPGTYTVTLTTPTAFTVTKSGGAVIGSGTVGEHCEAGGLSFTVTAGATPFIAGDSFTVTVAAGTEMEAGIDYLLTSYGLQITANSRIGGSGILADYSRVEASVLEVFQAAAGEHALHFAGINDAQDGLPYDVTLHRVKFDTIAELPVSSTEYVSLAITFESLPDYTRTAGGLSQFYTKRLAKKSD